MTWLDDQSIVCDLVLMPAPRDADLARLGGPRWLVYRRMVRARFTAVLAEVYEDFREALGTERFDALIDRFLAESPPRSPYLRDIPLEFLSLLEGSAGSAGQAAWPSFALDLARYEAATAEIAHRAAPDRSCEVVPLEMHRFAVLSPTARLLDLQHLVHRFDAAHRDVARKPVSLLIYRDAKSGEVETLELDPLASRIVRGVAREEAPLVEVARIAAGEVNAVIDAAFVESFGTLLTDLVERGVVLGSRKPPGL